jgi:hypothetical protein
MGMVPSLLQLAPSVETSSSGEMPLDFMSDNNSFSEIGPETIRLILV